MDCAWSVGNHVTVWNRNPLVCRSGFRRNESKKNHAEVKTDTGVKLNLLQNFWFINLDNFRGIYDNKTVETETDAWLAFLCFDRPEQILRLIRAFPSFTEYYEDLYELAANTERVMDMFSKELQELDEGTIQLMIDEYQDEIKRQADTIDQQADTIRQLNQMIAQLQQELRLQQD